MLKGYEPSVLIKLFRKIIKKINDNVLDLNEKKLEIKSFEIVNSAHCHNYRNGFYRAVERVIGVHCALGISIEEIKKLFIHELSHAYQHQIIPGYYQDIIRETSNKKMHDLVFENIKNKFNTVINDCDNL